MADMKRTLNSLRQYYLRGSAGAARRSKIRNEEMKRILKAEGTVVHTIANVTLNGLAHFLIMPEKLLSQKKLYDQYP